MIQSLRLRLRALFRRRAVEVEISDELRFHLEQETRLNIQRGMSPTAAARQARVAFGNLDGALEGHRDARGTRGLEDTIADTRYALRSLWRDRALSVAGVLTLALGIGATTAVFSAVNAVLLRELPFSEPARLVSLWEENPERGWYKNWVAPANYYDWREQASAFEGVAAYSDFLRSVTLLGQGEPRLLATSDVTGNFFSVLGVRPRLGRGFEPRDDWDEGQRPMILSDRLWRTMFRGDTAVIGTTVSLGGRLPWQIVGVMPPGFSFPAQNTDIWLPVLFDKTAPTRISFRRAHWLRVVARLKPGVSETAANASLQTVVKRLQEQYPQTNTNMGAGITPLHEWVIGNTKRPLVVLLSAAAVLLLIACANVGNLLLVHSLGRARDVSLRFALGATRSRVVQQALTESLVLSAIGGAAGCALGWAGARALLALQPPGLLPVTNVAIDLRVLTFAVVITTVTGLLFGVAPALIATQQAPADALHGGGRATIGHRAQRWGRRLVVAEVSLAVVLTIGAGLLLRSDYQLSRVPAGFDAQGVMTAEVAVPASRYDSAAKVVNFYKSLLQRVQAIPGVDHAAAVRQLPATMSSWTSTLAIRGHEPLPQTDVIHREVLGDYFRTMRVPLLKGRLFDDTDSQNSPLVVVINETLAKQYFAGEDPIGQAIAFNRIPDSTTAWWTIIGVVGSERQGSLATPPGPEMFAPLTQGLTRSMVIVARAAPGVEPERLAAPMRQAVRDIDSLLAITSLRTMADVHAASMARQRFTSALVLAFAVTGVVLAFVGIFGVLAQMVQARWREMGVRLALGAQRSQVQWLVVRSGGRLLAAGIATGILVALGATQVLGALLFEVRPTDAFTYATVAVVLAGVGLLAAFLPAWRASGANPAHTLRSD